MKKFIFLACFLFILSNVTLFAQNNELKYDLIIKNGRIINPDTKLDQTGLNIGINGGKIAALTTETITGKQEIDASGLVVTPGFIDLLSYNPTWIGVWNKLADGITTNLGMHGTTADPIRWFAEYDKRKLPLNYGGSFFYTQARLKFGLGRYQTATKEQIAEIYNMGEKALLNGCLGISMSLEYVPGISAEECLAMNKLAYKYNVAVYYHLRYSDMEEPGTNFDALKEAIAYARETGAAFHIDHINSTGGTYSMKETLALLNKVKIEGFDISACEYPYNYWATYLNSARFDPGWQERFHITYNDLQLGGSSERLTKESYEYYRKQGMLANAYAIPEEDVREALRCPWVMMGSDGILEPGFNNHPRASGMCARLIGHYVRDEKVLSLMDAIAKLTILPAKRMEPQSPALKNKGRIAVGADADIVVFDYNKIIDRATPEHPDYMSTGIEYVVVGGGIVKDPRGFNRNIRNGTGIKSQFVKPQLSNKTIEWNKQQIPVITYQNQDYIDTGWLAAMGYQLETDKSKRKLAVKSGTMQNSPTAPTPPEVPMKEYILERGYTMDYKGQSQNLICIGERFFVPVKGLEILGIKFEENGDNIKILAAAAAGGVFDYWRMFLGSIQKVWDGFFN